MIRIRDSIRVPGRVRVTWWLVAINLIAFMASRNDVRFFLAGGVIPAEFFEPEMLAAHMNNLRQQVPPDVAFDRAPWFVTLIWAMFLHSGWHHILTNLAILALLGPNVEATLGRGRFLLFYFACGVVGYFAQILADLDSIVPIIGASSPISGLMGAYMALFFDHYIRITVGNIHSPNYRDVMLPVKALLIFWLISQVFYGTMQFILPAEYSPIQIAYLTHFGGFICGYLLVKRGRPGGPGKFKFKVYDGGRSGKWTPPYGGTD